ncbi:chromate efflux transporter [Bowmanella pacifica]|uniref:Chromate transporter n=1 Tax=Bowmanella pacifica TaxID=502051 RepID=A0A918DH78_9ALTE|nr:chromate efflux transporter [Bowmanella pacifica]GGO66014.1 chromate transporter [Bowmanella pacifica]
MNASSYQQSLAGISMWTLFWVFLRLGLTSFGGPVAHLGFFRTEFVDKRRWLSESAYAELIALCQFLPGPASSQVGMAIGLLKGGMRGALLAWLGFTLPSALLLTLFALHLQDLGQLLGWDWLHGLKVLAVAVVAHAVLSMGRSLCPDVIRRVVALVACFLLLLWPGSGMQLLVIVVAAVSALWWGKPAMGGAQNIELNVPLSKTLGGVMLLLCMALLLTLPLLAEQFKVPLLSLFDSVYRAGALVFGGGHVVLPLLQAELVLQQISPDTFLAGYGAAQAVPGPLFTFAAFVGASSPLTSSGWLAAMIALVGIFLPGCLLVIGTLPFWSTLRKHHLARQGLLGANAAVVGMLLAVLINPLLGASIQSMQDALLALLAFALLQFVRLSAAWLVLPCAVLAGLGWLAG